MEHAFLSFVASCVFQVICQLGALSTKERTISSGMFLNDNPPEQQTASKKSADVHHSLI